MIRFERSGKIMAIRILLRTRTSTILKVNRQKSKINVDSCYVLAYSSCCVFAFTDISVAFFESFFKMRFQEIDCESPFLFSGAQLVSLVITGCLQLDVLHYLLYIFVHDWCSNWWYIDGNKEHSFQNMCIRLLALDTTYLIVYHARGNGLNPTSSHFSNMPRRADCSCWATPASEYKEYSNKILVRTLNYSL